MPVTMLPSFLLYCFTGGITPGPANLCSLSAALRYGPGAALRQWRGLFTGFLLISLVSVAITWRLGAALGQYVGMLSWLGAVYMLWLAWHIARSPKSGAAKDPAAPTFRTALSAYVLPYTRSFWALLGVGLFLPFTGPVCNLVWLFAGASLQSLFTSHRGAVDTTMAAALVLCAFSLVWPFFTEGPASLVSG